jgi:IPT/TIG domain
MATTYINTEDGNVLNTESLNRLITENSGGAPVVTSPIVSSISPNTGPTTGNTTVTITGSNFTGTLSVSFGNIAASSFIVNSDTSITAVSPTGTGVVDVTVTNPNGTSATSNNDKFTYTAIVLPFCSRAENLISTYITGTAPNGGFTINASYNQIAVGTAYAYATPVYVNINIATGAQTTTILNLFSIFIQYGDGVEEEITQVTDSVMRGSDHVYKWPGKFEVKVSVIPKNGCPPSIYRQTVTVKNYVTDYISWDYSRWPELTQQNLSLGALFHGYQSCPPGQLNAFTPLTFAFSASNQLSGNIVFDLYSQGSLSQPWETTTPDNKYAQLRPRWRFTDLNGNFITSLTATNFIPVYSMPDGTQVSQGSGTLVGYYGSVDFYYIDDIPSLVYNNGFTVTTPRLWVTYNTTNIPNLQDNNDGNAPSYSNSTVQLSTLFYVKNLSADHFNVTVDGGTIPLPTTIWPDTDNQFIVTVNSVTTSSAGLSSVVLLNYPLLGATYTNILASITPSIAASIYTPAFKFSRYDNLGRDTGGYYKNILSTLPLSAMTSPVMNTNLLLSTKNFTTIVEPAPYGAPAYYTAANALANATLKTTSLTGTFNFNVTNFYQKYFVRKVNENFNYGALLKSYLLQPFLQEDTNLITYLSAVGGDNVHPRENFGTLAYEKTANFVENNSDPLTSGVNQLYSLANLVDTEFDNYNLNAPPQLKRQFDLYSTPHERLWGTREKYNTNFNAITDHVNLGSSLTQYPLSATVKAGNKIVVNDKFNATFYELLEVPIITSYASITANNMQAYFPPANNLTFPLTSYPLSSFYGWGLNTPVYSNYRFYYYVNTYTNTPVDGLIDWNTRTDGLSTTLTESASSVVDWYADNGILENIYSYYITQGLNLLGSKYYKQ